MSLADRIAYATEHPAAEGMAASLVLVAGLVGPVVAGWYLAEYYLLTVGSQAAWLTAYAFGAGWMFIGVYTFNRLLYETVVGVWFGRFMDWAARGGLVGEEWEGEA